MTPDEDVFYLVALLRSALDNGEETQSLEYLITLHKRSGWTTLATSGINSIKGKWNLTQGTFWPQANRSSHPPSLPLRIRLHLDDH